MHKNHLQIFGWITVICGCMFCGKTTELIRLCRLAQIAKEKVLIFKHCIDIRYSDTALASHDDSKLEAMPIHLSTEIFRFLETYGQPDVIAIDEAQFFKSSGDSLVETVLALSKMGIRVIVAGLDQDFRGQPFGPMPNLLAIAHQVRKLQAICVKCHGVATMTQRLVNGEPAFWDDPLEAVGGSEMYEARCADCHEVRRK